MTVSAGSIEGQVDKARTVHLLAPGARVRRESLGLLFYLKQGPRLFFVSSGPWLDSDYFFSGLCLEQWLETKGRGLPPLDQIRTLKKALQRLVEKGVLLAHRVGASGA